MALKPNTINSEVVLAYGAPTCMQNDIFSLSVFSLLSNQL